MPDWILYLVGAILVKMGWEALSPEAVIYLAVLGLTGSGFALMALLEQKNKWGRNALSEATGILELREKLDPITDKYLALGANKLLERAASQRENPVLKSFSDQTLAKYRHLTTLFVAAGYAHDAVSSVVLDSERQLNVTGIGSALHIRNVLEASKRPIELKQINVQLVTQYGGKPAHGPNVPEYSPASLVEACSRMLDEVASGLAAIQADQKTIVSRMASAQSSLAACEGGLASMNAKVNGIAAAAAGAAEVSVLRQKLANIGVQAATDPYSALIVCTALDAEIALFLKVNTRLALTLSGLVTAEKTMESLTSQQVKYAPFNSRKEAILAKVGQIVAKVRNDPNAATKDCTDVEADLANLGKELAQVTGLVTGIADTRKQIAAQNEWVSQIRHTQVTCPWHSVAGEPPMWKLTNADTNPDATFAQSEAFLARSMTALIDGQIKEASDAKREADTLVNQAVSRVKGVFNAKTSLDDAMPKAQIQLANLRGELNNVGFNAQSQEMARLVGTTCDAIDQRLKEVHNFYGQEKFHEALALFSGAQGAEQALPVSKLLDQAKGLLKLLQDAHKAALEAEKKAQDAIRQAQAVADNAVQQAEKLTGVSTRPAAA